MLRIEKETEEETYKNLPYYFSKDLIANIEKIDKPIVILLDTYEKLVNELSDKGYCTMKDLWLRNDNGPIVQVPGVLWVIAGREKIKWEEYDKDWKDTLEQHILGDLSFNDANEFLEDAGIIDPNLRKEIYELTNGTPVYLDICVDTYELLRNRKEEITINKFGINIEELVERYIRYMDIQTSEIVYMLSNIDNWNDRMIQKVGEKILPNFSILRYNRIKELSFILEDSNNYYLHKTVKNIFKEDCPKLIKNKTLEVLNEYYYDIIDEMSGINEEYEMVLDRYFENIEKYLETLELQSDINDELFNLTYTLNKIMNHATRNLFFEKSEYIYNKLYSKYYNTESFYHLEMIKFSMLYEMGKYYEARNIFESQIDYMIKENDYSQILVWHAEILTMYRKYPNYHQIKKIIIWLEECKIYKNIVLYLQLGLNDIIGNKEFVINVIEENLKKDSINENDRCLLLCRLIDIFIRNDEPSDIKKYKKYVLELEEYIENENVSEYNREIEYMMLSKYYSRL